MGVHGPHPWLQSPNSKATVPDPDIVMKRMGKLKVDEVDPANGRHQRL